MSPVASVTRRSSPSVVIIFWTDSTCVRSIHSIRQGTSAKEARTSGRSAIGLRSALSPAVTGSTITVGGRVAMADLALAIIWLAAVRSS